MVGTDSLWVLQRGFREGMALDMKKKRYYPEKRKNLEGEKKKGNASRSTASRGFARGRRGGDSLP